MDLNVAKELHAPKIQKFKKRKIITLGIDDLWAADLITMNKYSRTNKGYKYILNIIDTFSKFMWLVPLKQKTGKEVTTAFQNIITNTK